MATLQTAETPVPRHSLSSRNKIQETKNGKGSLLNKLIQRIFYTHLVLIAALIIFITFRVLLSSSARNHPSEWHLIIISSTALSGITGFSWQALTTFNPSKTFKITFWISPLLTCALGVLLVLIGKPASLAASAVAIISSIITSLYACWANPRSEHAIKILTLSLAYQPPRVETAVTLSLVASILYSSLIMSGIAGATISRTKLDTLFVFLILGSLTWTMQIIKNTMQVAVSHVKYMQLACGTEADLETVVKNTVKYSMGSICTGSILVPTITVIRASARAVSSVSGDVDEFLFSCASCCSGVASRIVECGNRWGFVHVGVYGKGIVQASMDTWEMFTRVGIEELINCDLTSSFCFLCGVAGGGVCGLVGGIWAILVQKGHATEVTIYAFLIGYFMNRVAMARVQASVAAYYVAYAENPQAQQFDNTISAYIMELQRSKV